MLGRDLGSPIFFQGIYNKQDFFITCKNTAWSLCWLVLTLARGHICQQPCQHAALAVTIIPMATNSHWEKEVRSLKKDPDRTAKTEFFYYSWCFLIFGMKKMAASVGQSCRTREEEGYHHDVRDWTWTSCLPSRNTNLKGRKTNQRDSGSGIGQAFSWNKVNFSLQGS